MLPNRESRPLRKNVSSFIKLIGIKTLFQLPFRLNMNKYIASGKSLSMAPIQHNAFSKGACFALLKNRLNQQLWPKVRERDALCLLSCIFVNKTSRVSLSWER